MHIKDLITPQSLINAIYKELSEFYATEDITRITDCVEKISPSFDDGGKTLDIIYKHEWGADIVSKFLPMYIDSHRVVHMFRNALKKENE